MKKMSILLFLVIILSFLFGCVNSFEEFFEYNLFAGLDPVITPTVDELESMDEADAIDVLNEEFTSPSFVASLQEDAVKQEELKLFLEGIFENVPPPVDDPEALAVYQEASILYAEVNMVTSGGDEFAGNLINVISTLGDSDTTSTNEGVKEIFQNLVPEKIDTKTGFVEMITGMREASQGYLSFGSSLDINSDGSISEEEKPADINLGEVTQSAAIAVMVDKFITTLETNGGEDPVGGIYEWLVNGAEPNFMAEDFQQSFTSLTEDPAMGNLLDSTGILDILFPGEDVNGEEGSI